MAPGKQKIESIPTNQSKKETGKKVGQFIKREQLIDLIKVTFKQIDRKIWKIKSEEGVLDALMSKNLIGVMEEKDKKVGCNLYIDTSELILLTKKIIKGEEVQARVESAPLKTTKVDPVPAKDIEDIEPTKVAGNIQATATENTDAKKKPKEKILKDKKPVAPKAPATPGVETETPENIEKKQNDKDIKKLEENIEKHEQGIETGKENLKVQEEKLKDIEQKINNAREKLPKIISVKEKEFNIILEDALKKMITQNNEDINKGDKEKKKLNFVNVKTQINKDNILIEANIQADHWTGWKKIGIDVSLKSQASTLSLANCTVNESRTGAAYEDAKKFIEGKEKFKSDITQDINLALIKAYEKKYPEGIQHITIENGNLKVEFAKNTGIQKEDLEKELVLLNQERDKAIETIQKEKDVVELLMTAKENDEKLLKEKTAPEATEAVENVTPVVEPSTPTRQIETDPIKLLEASNQARKEYYASKKDFSKLGKSITQADKEILEKKKNIWDKSKQAYITELLGNSPDANRPKVVAFLEEEAEFELEQKGGVGRVVSKNIEKWDKWGIDHLDKNGELVKGNWKTRLLKTGITTTLLGLTTYFGLTKLGIGEQSRLGEATSYLSRRLEMGFGFGGLSTLIAESGIKNEKVKKYLQYAMMGSGVGLAFATGGLSVAGLAAVSTVVGIGLSKITKKLAKSEDELTKEMLGIKTGAKIEIGTLEADISKIEKDIEDFNKRARNQRIFRKIAEATGALAGASATIAIYEGASHHDNTTKTESTSKHETQLDNTGADLTKQLASSFESIHQPKVTFQETPYEIQTKIIEAQYHLNEAKAELTNHPDDIECKNEVDRAQKELADLNAKKVEILTIEKTQTTPKEIMVDKNAIVHKAGADGMGGGISYAEKAQTDADPQLANDIAKQIGFHGDTHSPEFAKAMTEYFGHRDASGHEVRIHGDAQENVAYQFRREADGTIVEDEIKMTDNSHGVVQETHKQGDKFETDLEKKYEYNYGKAHHYENGHEIYDNADYNGQPGEVFDKNNAPGPQSEPPPPPGNASETIGKLDYSNLDKLPGWDKFSDMTGNEFSNARIIDPEELKSYNLIINEIRKASMENEGIRKLTLDSNVKIEEILKESQKVNAGGEFTYRAEDYGEKEKTIEHKEDKSTMTGASKELRDIHVIAFKHDSPLSDEQLKDVEHNYKDTIHKIFIEEKNWEEIDGRSAYKFFNLNENKIDNPEKLAFHSFLKKAAEMTHVEPEGGMWKKDELNDAFTMRLLIEMKEQGITTGDVMKEMGNDNQQMDGRELSPIGGTVAPAKEENPVPIGGKDVIQDQKLEPLNSKGNMETIKPVNFGKNNYNEPIGGNN